MAVDISPQLKPHMRRNLLRRVLEAVHIHTKPVALVPLAYTQIVLPGGTGARAFTNVPSGAVSFTLSVETGSLRYCDSDTPGPTYGELWPAGTAFSRTIWPITAAMVCADTSVAGNSQAVANISYYGYRGE